jgi:hypothetical protein
MRVVPSCRDGQYLDTRSSSKLTNEEIVRHIDMMEARAAIRGLYERMVQWGLVERKKKRVQQSNACRGKETRWVRSVWWIYAETDTSFEVSGVPLATAAKETESLWGSAGTGAGVETVAS